MPDTAIAPGPESATAAAFADIESAMGDTHVADDAQNDAPPEKAEPTEKKAPPERKPGEKTPPAKALDKKPDEKKPAEKVLGIEQLRKNHDELKAKYETESATWKQKETQIEQLTRERDEIRRQVPSPEQRKELAEANSSLKKIIDQQERIIRKAAYTESEHYKTNHLSKINGLRDRAFSNLRMLPVTTGFTTNADTGEKTPQTRPGSPEDFLELVETRNPERLVKLAQEKFGTAYPMVLNAVLEYNQAFEAAQQDKDTHIAEADRERKEAQAKHEQDTATARDTWKAVNEELTTKYAADFGPSDDKDEQAATEKSQAYIESLFNAKADGPTKMRNLAIVKARAIGFGRAKRFARKETARADAAEAESKKFRSSQPGNGAPRRETSAAGKRFGSATSDALDDIAKSVGD